MASENPPLIWIDCEMTGLSLAVDVLVEIAVLVTDADLNIIGEGVDVVIRADAAQLAGMNDFVTQMHTSSGLITEIPEGIDVATAEELILIYLQASGAQPGKSPLAGNSVSVDRSFIARDMPCLNEFLHYRTVDVSSIKELARRWHPRIYFNSPSKSGNHRALGDIKDSINELKYYRETIFVASPGPETKFLREVAQKFGPVQPEQVTTD
ncbi:MAG TPA: oligoribonuclease [Candidatus Paceibacterota bacterium]|nr:oligoribonuclease [Candidatus Paceibacterota bacterium]